MATLDNLQAAFAGESQANRKYLAFAKKAEQEGYPNIARLFRAAAQAETVHAHSHLRVMKGIADTARNLQAAIDGEGYEVKDMYPAMLAEAEKEGDQAAARSFKNALAVEKVHHALYSKALETFKAGKDLPSEVMHVCDVCGYTIGGEIPEICPVCGAQKKMFSEAQ